MRGSPSQHAPHQRWTLAIIGPRRPQLFDQNRNKLNRTRGGWPPHEDASQAMPLTSEVQKTPVVSSAAGLALKLHMDTKSTTRRSEDQTRGKMPYSTTRRSEDQTRGKIQQYTGSTAFEDPGIRQMLRCLYTHTHTKHAQKISTYLHTYGHAETTCPAPGIDHGVWKKGKLKRWSPSSE